MSSDTMRFFGTDKPRSGSADKREELLTTSKNSSRGIGIKRTAKTSRGVFTRIRLMVLQFYEH